MLAPEEEWLARASAPLLQEMEPSDAQHVGEQEPEEAILLGDRSPEPGEEPGAGEEPEPGQAPPRAAIAPPPPQEGEQFVFKFGLAGGDAAPPVPQQVVIRPSPGPTSVHPSQPLRRYPDLGLAQQQPPQYQPPPSHQQQQQQQQAEQLEHKAAEGGPLAPPVLNGLSLEQLQSQLREQNRSAAGVSDDPQDTWEAEAAEIIVTSNGSRFAKHRAHRDETVSKLVLHYHSREDRIRRYNPNVVFEHLDNVHGQWLLVPIGDAFGHVSLGPAKPQESEAQRRTRLIFKFRQQAAGHRKFPEALARLRDEEALFYLQSNGWVVNSAVDQWLEDVAWEAKNPPRKP